jgi:hypothetical protein
MIFTYSRTLEHSYKKTHHEFMISTYSGCHGGSSFVAERIISSVVHNRFSIIWSTPQPISIYFVKFYMISRIDILVINVHIVITIPTSVLMIKSNGMYEFMDYGSLAIATSAPQTKILFPPTHAYL